jgi:phosphatidylserine decarboxylase
MTTGAPRGRQRLWEEINFLLTNRIPRRWLTQFMGWFSQIEQPLVRDFSLAVWRSFSNLNLEEARKTRFRSVHDCFTRELKEGARPIDPGAAIVISPSDGIVGAFGRIEGTTLVQAKGFPYTLQDLLGDPALVDQYRDGWYVTLRLKASMYHRFHAPHDCRVRQVTYVAGDTWNVNPIALERVERLFCKNERATIVAELAAGGHAITLVPVAAVLVAGIRLHFLDTVMDLKYKGPRVYACDVALRKGEEMGWFQHGSTIIVFAPPALAIADNVRPGATVRMGQALLRLPMPV